MGILQRHCERFMNSHNTYYFNLSIFFSGTFSPEHTEPGNDPHFKINLNTQNIIYSFVFFVYVYRWDSAENSYKTRSSNTGTPKLKLSQPKNEPNQTGYKMSRSKVLTLAVTWLCNEVLQDLIKFGL